MKRRWCLLGIAGIAVLLVGGLTGCGGVQLANQIERSTAAGDYAAALAAIEKGKQNYSGSSSLLYYLDRGALLQRLGEYSASNAELEQAEILLEQLYGTSISESAASLLVNDMTLSYTGEDFEQVMINIVKCLNYLYLHDLEGAQVEARKVNTRLLALSDKYGSDAVYKEDAFARYLAAFAQETGREYNDAYIDYKKAYSDYQWYQKYYGTPILSLIPEDLLRLSRWLGFTEDYQEWHEKFSASLSEPSRRPEKRSEILLVIYDGLIPTKKTRFVVTQIMDPDGHPYALKVAFPVMRPRPPLIEKVRVGLSDGQVVESQLAEPLSAIAIQNLNQRIGLISAKAIARATAKFIAAYQVRKATRSQNQGANILVDLATNVFTYATEQADTRSWRTLPNQFHLLRLSLPAGQHQLEVRIELLNGSTRSLPPLEIELKSGEKKVLPLYVPH